MAATGSTPPDWASFVFTLLKKRPQFWGSGSKKDAIPVPEELQILSLSLFNTYGSRLWSWREWHFPRQAPKCATVLFKGALFLQNVHRAVSVTLAYPSFKAAIKLVTQFLQAFQTDTKGPDEPLWSRSLVWRTISWWWTGWLALWNRVPNSPVLMPSLFFQSASHRSDCIRQKAHPMMHWGNTVPAQHPRGIGSRIPTNTKARSEMSLICK